MTTLNIMERRSKNSTGSWKTYYEYVVERAKYWIECGDQEWPNAIEPKPKTIESLAVRRAEKEADAKFNVVYEDLGSDA